jgi:hypothetical protein
MIKLVKTNIPDILAQNATEWTDEYLKEIVAIGDAAKAKPSRYAHAEVKAALRAETEEKCAYCESKFAHITFGDVEHIVAKKTEPKLVYEWCNLTLACDICNTLKGTKEGFVDPYTDDPAACVYFGGPWIAAVIGSVSGKLTVIVLQLNRTALLEKRKEKLDAFNANLENVKATKDATSRQILLNALVTDAQSPASEYSACLSAHIIFLQSHNTI